MLEFDETAPRAPLHDGGRRARLSVPAPAARFAFGGVRFEVHSELPFQLSPAFARHATQTVPEPISCGLLRCSVRLDASLAVAFPGSGVSVRREADLLHVATREMRGTVRSVGEGVFEGEARVSGSEASIDAVALAMSAAVIECQSGLHLHAAALELDGRAFLFIGPSGAGKSTALTLTRGAHVLAHDRVSVFARAGQYFAASLPGGESVTNPWCTQRVLPLASVLRVRQGIGRPRIVHLAGARRVFALRESVDVGSDALDAEDRRMNAVLALSEGAAVGEIHSVLGVCHAAQLRDLVSERTAAHALEVRTHAQP